MWKEGMVVSSLVVLAVAIAAGAAGGASSAAGDQNSPHSVQPSALQQAADSPTEQFHDGPPPDTTVTRIQLDDTGDAIWSLTVRTALDSDEDVDEFEAFIDEFESQVAPESEFRERMTDIVGAADRTTNRAMTADDFEATAEIQSIPRRSGIVRYEFHWDGFAAKSDDQVTVGDVFEGGFFLAEDDYLSLSSPEGYTTADAEPSPAEREDGTVRWEGLVDFADQRPAVTFEPANQAVEQSSQDGLPGSRSTILSGLLLFVVAGGVAVAYRSEQIELDSVTDSLFADDTASHSKPSESSKSDPATTAKPDTERLATDEDQVIAVLESEGGRIRQAAIAEQLDWSASKTSRVLSGMEADGQIEKLRIGRENVIDLADEDDRS